jgi:hypothetical protein
VTLALIYEDRPMSSHATCQVGYNWTLIKMLMRTEAHALNAYFGVIWRETLPYNESSICSVLNGRRSFHDVYYFVENRLLL